MSDSLDPHVLTAEINFTVEFYEVDSMQIVWHGNYIQFFERARCLLLDKIGYGYIQMERSGFAFPVADVQIKYIKPLQFKDRVCATAILDEYENRLRIKYELRNLATGELTTKAVITQLAVNIEKKELSFLCPAVFTDRVEELIRNGGFRE